MNRSNAGATPAEVDPPSSTAQRGVPVNKKKSDIQSTTSVPHPPSPHSAAADALPFPVVAIGASAGGVEALKQFFEAMPADSGLAFVVIQHLDPDKLSLMAEILARATTMTVAQARHGDPIEANHVYVAPPGKRVTMQGGQLTLDPLTRDTRRITHAVDEFLRSLAQQQGDRSICIILSGTGADGSVGLKTVKEAGGMVMVQDPAEAGYDGMPLSAMATGLVDSVLPVRAMADELLHYVHHAYFTDHDPGALPAAELEAQITEIIDLLSQRRGIDFSGYKRGTLVRRTERRMNLLHLQDIAAYRKRLTEDDEEMAALAKDLLIVVTGFFRDLEAFALLQAKVIAPLCQQATPERPIRVWVAGAATGEEAYSLAMLILEELDRCHKGECCPRIFATDVDKAALQQARAGIFPLTIEADITAERLRRFFDKEESGYRIKREVREAITFSEQDLIKDTPFSRIDLISCRNVLIYLTAETQRRVLALFHFALRPGGMLFLGNAESIGQTDELFRPLDKKWRIYQKIDTVRAPMVAFPLTNKGGRLHTLPLNEPKKTINLKALGESQLLQHFSPCAVMITHSLDIVQFLGDTALFLSQPAGEPTTNLLAMMPAIIRPPLRAMLQDLINHKPEPSTLLLRLPDQEGRPYRHIQINARRLEAPGVDQALYLVSFADLPPESEACGPSPANSKEGYAANEIIIKQLEEELRQTRETLESTIEQMEAANEELKANHEEAMSINEEFQSTNEELETSKEELQSMNEELSTVNAELLDKVTELELTNNDLDNILASSEVAFLFLDEQMRIKRFTPAIHKLFSLIPSDLGRPLADFGATFAGFDLLHDAKTVLEKLQPIEKEVQDPKGHWHLQRVLPYRTRENHIQGVLVTFLEITKLKEKAAESHRQGAYLKAISDTLPVRMAYFDTEERYRYVNDTYLRWSNLTAKHVLGKRLKDVVGATIYEAIAPQVAQALAGEQTTFEGMFDYPHLGRRHILVNHSPHFDPQGQVIGFFVLLQDVTDLKLTKSKAYLAAIVESSHDAIISRDFDGTIRSWNQGAERMFGYRSEEMIGQKIDALFLPRQSSARDDLAFLCHGAQAGHAEAGCLTKDGRRLAVLLTQSPIAGDDGQAVAVSVIMSDINTRKEMELQIREANRTLESKIAERTVALQEHMAQLRRLAQELTQAEQRERQRLAQVLHDDLQQLLVAAGLRLERLNNGEDDLKKREAIVQVEALITQAVCATRLLATDLRPPVLNSGNLVKSLHWLADWLWKRFDFSLKFDTSAELPMGTIPDGDIVFLFDTARELCFNIVKHAHVKEGRMTLRRTDDEHLCLTISDEGVGTDLEQQAEYVAAEGSGLGLGTIRDRLALIGGELRIRSAVGQGFSVDIIVPYDAQTPPVPQGPGKRREHKRGPRAELTAAGKIRVMLVDDHTVVRDGLKMILQDETDIDVVGEAGDGEKAVKLAGKLRPDVIIMDVNMPKVNGIEATRTIKQEYPAIGIIALSINDDPGTTKAMLEAGACAYLNKSGSAEEVCGVIRTCVAGWMENAPGEEEG